MTKDIELIQKISDILQVRDPMGIAFAPDEYSIEAEAIATFLDVCHTLETFNGCAHGVMVVQFSDVYAGTEESFLPISQEIWDLYYSI